MAQAEEPLDQFGFFLNSNDINVTKNSQHTPKDLNTLRRREQKWKHMFSHWSEYVTRHGAKLKERCRKGVSVKSCYYYL